MKKVNDPYKQNVNVILHTDGKGLYSTVVKAIRVTELELLPFGGYGELRVYFDPKKWNTNKVGLIYTDDLFEKELQKFLTNLVGSDGVSYSEKGMQGYDYVSLDTSPQFVKAWKKTFII